jgi:hypothetical protein
MVIHVQGPENTVCVVDTVKTHVQGPFNSNMSLCMVLITYLDIPRHHQFPVAAMGVASQCPT